jgi:hypothetical protein
MSAPPPATALPQPPCSAGRPKPIMPSGCSRSKPWLAPAAPCERGLCGLKAYKCCSPPPAPGSTPAALMLHHAIAAHQVAQNIAPYPVLTVQAPSLVWSAFCYRPVTRPHSALHPAQYDPSASCSRAAPPCPAVPYCVPDGVPCQRVAGDPHQHAQRPRRHAVVRVRQQVHQVRSRATSHQRVLRGPLCACQYGDRARSAVTGHPPSPAGRHTFMAPQARPPGQPRACIRLQRPRSHHWAVANSPSHEQAATGSTATADASWSFALSGPSPPPPPGGAPRPVHPPGSPGLPRGRPAPAPGPPACPGPMAAAAS